tara:strand:+ start:1327 stop:1524 length:198 start_codon:yes stop_codon:yes gene_type:complete
MALMDEILQATIGKREFVMTLTRQDKSIIQKTFENVSIEYFDDMYKLIMETRLYSKITVKLNRDE